MNKKKIFNSVWYFGALRVKKRKKKVKSIFIYKVKSNGLKQNKKVIT